MITENILLFPTLITLGKREVDELEKESWFSAYLEQSDKDGNSNEFTGHQSVHHDIRFKKVFSDIADTIRNHLTTLSVDTSMIEVYIQKSFFNVRKHNGNPLHNHIENHISFTYYPYIHESCTQELVFYQDPNRVNNDVYENFLAFNAKEWHDINATSYSLKVNEGDILMFKNAGAYCFTMSSNYNSRFRPAEVLWHNNRAHTIRKQETLDDLISNQILIDFSEKVEIN